MNTRQEFANCCREVIERTGICYEVLDKTIYNLMLHDQKFSRYILSLKSKIVYEELAKK